MTNIIHSFLLISVFIGGCASTPPSAVKPCNTYCSTYEEGYQWAQNASLKDERQCAGYAKDFIRGCEQEIIDVKTAFAPRDGF